MEEINKMKAEVYDLIIQQTQIQQHLQTLTQEINKRMQEIQQNDKPEKDI